MRHTGCYCHGGTFPINSCRQEWGECNLRVRVKNIIAESIVATIIIPCECDAISCRILFLPSCLHKLALRTAWVLYNCRHLCSYWLTTILYSLPSRPGSTVVDNFRWLGGTVPSSPIKWYLFKTPVLITTLALLLHNQDHRPIPICERSVDSTLSGRRLGTLVNTLRHRWGPRGDPPKEASWQEAAHREPNYADVVE